MGIINIANNIVLLTNWTGTGAELQSNTASSTMMTDYYKINSSACRAIKTKNRRVIYVDFYCYTLIIEGFSDEVRNGAVARRLISASNKFLVEINFC